MRTYIISLLLLLSLAVTAQDDGVMFRSSDKAIELAFNRAKQMALSYKGKEDDPVGPWYESALPPRYAFCMRDVSHQSIGGEILGLAKENKNMFRLFAKNISANKNWCSYWEINREGKPAPEDYRNDKEFWYNLNANFDILNACWRMYLWTGDKEYINGADFAVFHERSVREYIDAWTLQPDSLLSRPAHPNAPVPFNPEDAFHRCRGLPSYSEGVPGLKMGADLVAALYRGMLTYAEILQLNANNKLATEYRLKALRYQQQLDAQWWDNEASLYYTHFTGDGKPGKGEGETFLLWFDALAKNDRREKTIEHLLKNNWNVENLSYFPYLLCKFGYSDKAYDYMLHLTDLKTARREYPEVSYGVIEGIVQGLMGIDADARANRISTLYSGKATDSMMVEQLPVLAGYISVGHQQNSSWLQNNGKKPLVWRARFAGAHAVVHAGGQQRKAQQEQDRRGRMVSFVNITVLPGVRMQASVD